MKKLIPITLLNRLEYSRQKYYGHNERPIEYGFVMQCIRQYQPMTILDVGTGQSALPALMRNCGPFVTAIDNIKDFWPRGMFNRHYHVINDDIRTPNVKNKYDMITCISTLEHIPEFDLAVRNMLDLLTETGSLVMTFPCTPLVYLYNVYDLPESNAYRKKPPYITQSFTRRQVARWGIIKYQEFWRCWEGDFWTCGMQVDPVKTDDRYQLACIILKKV